MRTRILRSFSIAIMAMSLWLVARTRAHAQPASTYTVAYSTGATLITQTSPLALLTAPNDDAVATSSQSIGFNFLYEGVTYSHLVVSPDGFIKLGTSSAVTAVNDFSNSITAPDNSPILFPYWDDLALGGTGLGGYVNYSLEGAAPNRRCVIEWFVTIPRDVSGTPNTKFQLVLNETTNTIQFIYGGTTTSTTQSASVGIIGATIANYISLTPSTSGSSTATPNDNNTAYPAVGTMVTLSPPAACTGTPPAGTAVASAASVCPSAPFTVTWNGSTTAVGGLTYQLQTSTTGVPASYTNSGAAQTTPTFTVAGITATTYYRVVVTCTSTGGGTATSVADTVLVNPFTVCYCSPLTGTVLHTSVGDYFSNVAIAGTTLNSSNGTNSATGYTQVAPTPAANTASLSQGVTYTLTATYSSLGVPTQAAIWIDYNANGVFNTSEYIPLVLGTTSATATFTVPSGATITPQTGLRVRARGGTFTSDACEQYGSGETEDYLVSLVAGTPCAGTPTAGTATASVASICPSQPFTVSAIGASSGVTGLSFQLQTSATGAAGSYTNSGASQTNPIFNIAGITANTYYQIVVACAGGGSATTVADTVLVNPFTACYCNTNLGGACAAGNANIDGVTFNTLSNLNNGCNTSTAANGAYTQYAATGANTTSLVIGAPYTFTITTNAAAITSVWIDYNHDGTWSASEHTQVNLNSSNATATITIPTGALPGPTGMRVRSRLTSNPNGPTDACTNFGSGETEDYVVTLVAPQPCAGTPLAGTAVTSNATPCPGTQVTVSLTGGTTATGITYGLQVSTTSGTTGFGPTTTTNATGVFTVTPPPGNNWYRIVTTCANGGASANSIAIQVTGGSPISTLPWDEGFEGVTTTGNNFPPCWRKINGDWLTSDANYTSYNDPRTGTRYLTEAWSATNEWMMTPGFQLTAGTSYDFSFYWAGDTYSSWLGNVGVNNIQDSTAITFLGAPFVNVGTPTTGAYQQVIRTFVPTTTGVYYFGVRVNEATGSPWYLGFDDFRVNITPTCPQPIVSLPTNITATAATLNWTAGTSTPPGIGYQWEVRSSGAPGSGGAGLADAGTTGPAVNTVTTTAPLAGNTTYTAYVRAICTAGDSSFWSSITFTTLCPTTFGLPFTENFSSTNMPPDCWSADQGFLTATPSALTNVGYSNWYSDTYLNGGVNNAATANVWYLGSQREWIISPSINLGTTPGNFMVEFNLGVTAYGNTTPTALGSDDTVAVVVSTDNGATWTSANALQVWTATTTPINATTGGQRFFVPMNGYSGIVKIGWYASNGVISDAGVDNEVFVDSVRVVSTCTPPSVTLGNDTSVCGNVSVLELNAGSGPAGTTYTWSNSFNTTTATTQAFNAAAVINAFDANPNPLANVVSFYSTVTVSPGCAKSDTIDVAVVYTPRVTGISAIPAGTGNASWDFAPTGEQFASSYVWTFGDGGVSAVDSPSHTYATNGTYTVRLIIGNACGNDTVTTTVTVTTGVSDALVDGSKVNIFPNPTAADAVLEVSGGASLRSYQVMSATGALVQDRTIKGTGVTSTTLNTRALAPGIYTLRIQLDKGVVVRKLEVLK